jgi:hypothetical protein
MTWRTSYRTGDTTKMNFLAVIADASNLFVLLAI